MTFENPIQDYVDIVKHGISKKFKDGKPKKVIIVGTGLTGFDIRGDYAIITVPFPVLRHVEVLNTVVTC